MDIQKDFGLQLTPQVFFFAAYAAGFSFATDAAGFSFPSDAAISSSDGVWYVAIGNLQLAPGIRSTGRSL